MDPQFAYSIAHGLDIAWVSLSQPIRSRCNQRSGTLIMETRSPLPKRFGLLDLNHM